MTEDVMKALEVVTPGPWIAEANGVYAFDGVRLVASLKEHIGGRDWPTTEMDRDFIAWCREGVPALAAELAAQTARADAAEARAADLAAKLESMRAALSHTADQALAAEIPVGYGPEDKGAWTQGYDAAIHHARAAIKSGGAA